MAPVAPVGPVEPVMPVAPVNGPIRSMRKEAFTGLFTSAGSVTIEVNGVAFCRLTIVPAVSPAVTIPLTATVELFETACTDVKVWKAIEDGGSPLEYWDPGI